MLDRVQKDSFELEAERVDGSRGFPQATRTLMRRTRFWRFRGRRTWGTLKRKVSQNWTGKEIHDGKSGNPASKLKEPFSDQYILSENQPEIEREDSARITNTIGKNTHLAL